MHAVTERWARFGPKTLSGLAHTPDAGVCISAFLIVRNGDSILLCLPKAHGAWPAKGGYSKDLAAKLQKEGSWLLPATHLLMEESPENAARRITKEWAGINGIPRFMMLQSHVRPPSPREPRAKGNHWDLCFIYELEANTLPKLKPWWSDVRFVPRSRISQTKLGRGHLDILEEGGYLQPSKG